MFSRAYNRIRYSIRYRFWYALFLATGFSLLAYSICPSHPYMFGLACVALYYAYESR